MEYTSAVEPVQIIAWILHSVDQKMHPLDNSSALLAPEFKEAIEHGIGKVEYWGSPVPFNNTAYYEQEYGSNLYRYVIGLQELASPEEVVQLKHSSYIVEHLFCNSTKRSFNLDAGYMDTDKVVLPSFKRGPFKIYSSEGIWLDMQYTYAKGQFTATSWAFPDFKNNLYHKDLLRIRELYKKKLKNS
jgi:hypothetical protein